MSKRSSHEVSDSFHALITDVRGARPDLVPYFLEALARVLRLVETRGLGIICIDMPGLVKVIDKSLSSGYFDSSKVPASLGSSKRGYLLQELLENELYEPHTGHTYATVDPTFIFLVRTFLCLNKDMIKEPSDERISESVRAFFHLDGTLRAPSYRWDCDDLFCESSRRLYFTDGHRSVEKFLHLGLSPDTCPAGLLVLLDKVCRMSSSMLGHFAPEELCGRHGPGAVADIRTGEDKFLFPNWPRKLGLTFPHEQFAYANESIAYFDPQPVSIHEPPAKLLAVPKSMKGPRLITSEPTAHQFLQQGLLRWLRYHLPKHLSVSIDFKSQEPSRLAALKASRDGKSMTVDLSNASDLLSLWTVERAFNGNFSVLRALHATRTRWVRNSTKCGPDYGNILLKKYAGQGNATTFPVQSIVYALVCIACVLYDEGGSNACVDEHTMLKAARKVRVYGDDIILPSSSGQSLAGLLQYLQLQINWGKTHHKGWFRESCGIDAYRGYDVTPLYMQAPTLPSKPSPTELVSWIDVTNNAYTKGLWALSSWMISKIPEEILRDIPITRHPLACLRLITHTNFAHFRKVRVNPDLHRTEVYGYVVQSKEVRERRDTHQSLHQYFVENPLPTSNWKSGWVMRRRSLLRKRWVPTT